MNARSESRSRKPAGLTWLLFAAARVAPCRCQFGLRGLLTGMTVIGVMLGLLFDRARRQQEAVEAIRAKGGEVFYEAEEYTRRDGLRTWPHWLSALLLQHDDFFRTVVQVNHSAGDDGLLGHVARLKGVCKIRLRDASRVTDAGIAQLATLRSLRSIGLPNARVTDASLHVLGSLPKLTDLYIPGAHISNAGLAHLRGCTGLQYLSMNAGTGAITDDGMRWIGQLRALEELDLSDSNLTVVGIRDLRPLQKLRSLRLGNNQRLGDAALLWIASLQHLEELRMPNTGITASGLRELRSLTGLRVLDLSDNHGVTDDGMAALAELASLEELCLRNTSISSRGIEPLRRLPMLQELDISENGLIDRSVAALLASLPSLKRLDLHATNAAFSNDADAERLRHLRQLTSLRLLNVTSTGSDTSDLETVLPGCRVVGSYASGPAALGHEDPRDYYSVCTEVSITIKGDRRNHRIGGSKGMSQELLPLTLARMIAISSVSCVPHEIASQRFVAEDFARRLGTSLQDARRARTKILSELLDTARNNRGLHRLYVAAMDFNFADAIDDYSQHLEHVKRQWKFTTVEEMEYEEAPCYLRLCLDDAALMLGLPPCVIDGRSSNEICRTWRTTRRDSTPYAKCKARQLKLPSAK